MKNKAWIELVRSEEDEIWSSVYERLGFRPSVDEKDFPGYEEPKPSVTFSFQAIWEKDFSQLEADLQEAADAMFKRATPPGSFIYALDWQHQCYKFYPETVNSNEWVIPALPNGDYYLFLEKSLAYGWLGHPWEETICIFGKPLLDALELHRPKLFGNPIRRQD